MIALLIILLVSVVYALIRAKHDSYLGHGKWKLYALIEGVFIDVLTTIGVLYLFTLPWYFGLFLGFIYAFSFWLIFDCVQGYIRTGNILHLGDKGWDAEIRKAFLYNKPIGRWKETGSFRLIIVKLIWLLILIGGYLSL